MSLRTFLLIAIILLMAGCGGTYDSYVSGLVTLDRKPLLRGTISFKPVQPGPTAYGLISDDGSFTLKTGRESGLPSGEYVVAVVANEPSVSKEEGALPTPGKPITPLWYRSTKTSPLKITVDSGSNEIDLELTSEAPPGYEQPKQRRRK